MKDLIDKLLAAIPAYVRQFIALLSGPKRFVEGLDFESDTALEQALTFLAVTFALAFIVQVPLMPEKQNKEIFFGVSAVAAALSFVLSALILLASWRVVGGKLSWRKFAISSCYFSAISSLILLVAVLVAIGVLKLVDPADAAKIFGGTPIDPAEVTNWTALIVFEAIGVLGYLAAYVWVFAVWGAYRDLNQVSRLRSGIAFVIFVLLSIPALAAGLAITYAVSGGPGTAKVQLPTALVSKWETLKQTDNGDVRTRDVQTYTFWPNGTYGIFEGHASRDARCATMRSSIVVGQARVNGSTLTLHPGQRTDTLDDRCTGQKNESKQNHGLPVEEYQYEIRQYQDGQQLCLSGRYGQMCLKPIKQ